MLIFITGGVRSGKSTYAEKRAVKLHDQLHTNLYYVATGKVEDDEMKGRVKQHQRQRQQSSNHWHVIEKNKDLHELVDEFGPNEVVLIDCLTTLLTNEWFSGWKDDPKRWSDETFQQALLLKLQSLLLQLASAQWITILVTNEVSYESHVDELTISYKKMLGFLHQYAVALSTEAILVESGIPITMKGSESN
ncbi:bifunctional adenosylcobinamide kinase/adenosylcobinamide-phosphate guanylyltransferase [Alkalihalophilus lindianensis]|uniref:Adenosylcobinamide kinase n=1 Tax=Alkalihalophilus lindianensis TaxID=1630542 RepID=A0ABU3X707_9BACI|nr:bifunctional adenosylcobinamide kinase/adenosylcobinamide-phosphate guanylyltransferase [Alkalihalophilus lindianensis]MDV2683402.1 bifunctional adenosylcobinamide kinase/adenosylcobinamide-phosphate guanylyltransferase [Alkalihalophilus lindianensis]